MRTRQPERARSQWLPLDQVAPIPTASRRAFDGGGHDDAARAEVAATVALGLHPAPSRDARPRRRASATTWRGRTVAVLALVMALAAAVGLAELRAHGSSARQARPSVPVPGTGLVVDKPAGWTEGPVESAPSALTDLVDAAAGGGRGLFFTAPGGRALFVVDAPNSADLESVPPVPDRIGSAVVSGQAPFTHALGPARKVSAHSEDVGGRFGLDASYVLAEGRIVVVGAVAEGALDPATQAASEALLVSLRPH